MKPVAEERIAELRFNAAPDRLKLVRAVVGSAAELAGCRPEVVSKIVIAVNEACMNIIQHAYKGDASGEIVLVALRSDASIVFNLRDFAPPVDVSEVRSRDLDDLRPGGLGTYFIQEIMDEWYIRPLPDSTGNSMQLIKKIE